MGEVQIPDYPRGITFEQVWAALMEDRERQKESAREFDQRMKKIQKSIGGLSKTVGTMAENLLVPSLLDKFEKIGFAFQAMSPHRKIKNNDKSIYIEIDAFLENNEQAMVVETKINCKREDVDYHLKRMEKICHHAALINDKRHYYGAIAAAVIDDDTKRYALKNGFYVIELSGKDANIIKPDVEKVWQ